MVHPLPFQDVRGAVAALQDVADGGFDVAGGGLGPQRVAQEQSAGEDGRERVGLARARDVGSAAVARLVQAEDAARGLLLAQRGRGEHPEGAGEHGRLVAQDVAEEVLGHDDIERLRAADEVHGGGVYQLVREFDIRIVAGEVGDGLAPQAGGLQNVRLVHAQEATPALVGRLEADTGDSGDLALGVNAGVHGSVAMPAFRLAEIQAASQFADDEDVKAAFHEVCSQGAGRRQAGVQDTGAQVGIKAHLLPQGEQGTALRP